MEAPGKDMTSTAVVVKLGEGNFGTDNNDYGLHSNTSTAEVACKRGREDGGGH